MAEVLLAATEGGKLVVLKRIWADLATDPDFVTMFRDEARLAIRLHHPNVVQTYEVVEDAQQLAMAMEYLHGQQLATIIGRVGRIARAEPGAAPARPRRRARGAALRARDDRSRVGARWASFIATSARRTCS